MPIIIRSISAYLQQNLDGDEYRIGLPATDSQISAAEALLTCTFPEDYRDFLKAYGWLEVFNSYFFGVDGNGQEEGSVVRMTEYARAAWNLPNNLLVVHSVDDEVLWCIQCEIRTIQSCKVIAFDTASQRVTSVVARSFEACISEYLEGSV